jgi:hypothetical protein
MEASLLLSIFFGFATIGGGTFAWTHRRNEELNQRIDSVEMTLHKEFVRKDELMPMMDRLDKKIQHIDEKLDRILFNGRNFSS